MRHNLSCNFGQRRSGLIVPVYLMLLLSTTGCDTLTPGGGETITLTTTTGDLSFQFTGITSGGTRTIVSTNPVDLGSFLSNQGFSKTDVVSARVQSAEIRLRFPLGQNLIVFDEASLQLRSGGGTGVMVASSTTLADARRDDLSVTAGRDIGSIVRASSFEGVLALVGAATIQDDFEVTVNLTIAIDVTGI